MAQLLLVALLVAAACSLKAAAIDLSHQRVSHDDASGCRLAVGQHLC